MAKQLTLEEYARRQPVKQEKIAPEDFIKHMGEFKKRKEVKNG